MERSPKLQVMSSINLDGNGREIARTFIAKQIYRDDSGNTPVNAFSVKINRDEPISELKKVIKVEKQNDFANVDADKLKLWKVEIPDDHDSELANPPLDDELLAMKKISKYFPVTPAEECIHVIVEPLVSTTTSSREQELLDRIASLEASINKSVHEFDVIVSPKRTKRFKWTVNIEHATLEALKDSIRAVYQTPALENDGAVFNVNNLKFTVFIETPSKAFSDWTFPKVSELDARLKTIPISGNEASKLQYVCSYLVGKFELRPEKNITGPNGHGPVDFAIDLLKTAKSVGVTEVKDEDFYKGIAQNAVQLESALSNRKRKASEIEEGVFVGKVFGIVTDAKEWYFLECSFDNLERPKFKLSKPVVVVYNSDDTEGMVERVLGHIAWLLEEAQKPVEDLQSDGQLRVVKKHRSSSNLVEESG
ncbi:1326_t:CDS:2 [Paraglomus occultum]|uniref:1326_t:CDS:1 n=1 Tax=Paraglomus occultum TaxID=144539 RepID=A0A9N9CX59_9GLOM|nr:1326_t:CDS:2 [Paraglomus occultum]